MPGNNMFSEKDTADINELASLNEDISPELIEQLQQKISQDAKNFKQNFNEDDDTTLFEEVSADSQEEAPPQKIQEPATNFEDKFLKKFQEKRNSTETDEASQKNSPKDAEAESTISSAAFCDAEPEPTSQPSIEQVSNGNITEKAITPEQKSYNDSLDFLDGNVKYSKYVIYIDPQNVDFIEGLTVKERKNLINRILREQDDIGITKRRFKVIQTIIKHVIVAILTITISIPVIYYTINASLEASINNYRRSQTNFQTLYKQNGKISRN